jgi:hypothetical protein
MTRSKQNWRAQRAKTAGVSGLIMPSTLGISLTQLRRVVYFARLSPPSKQNLRTTTVEAVSKSFSIIGMLEMHVLPMHIQ